MAIRNIMKDKSGRTPYFFDRNKMSAQLGTKEVRSYNIKINKGKNIKNK